MNNENTNEKKWNDIVEAIVSVLNNNISKTETIDLLAIFRGSSYKHKENKNG
jgi:hypothetical protein